MSTDDVDREFMRMMDAEVDTASAQVFDDAVTALIAERGAELPRLTATDVAKWLIKEKMPPKVVLMGFSAAVLRQARQEGR